ncbi:hypothetical protein NDU88_004654 [Pleurodeles waltl]|uniref:Uncharacterized protein n=1 Tax=Pleurodeles waltl TaxID=8319 RepID=A0AAV7NT34_PLEWA|nr:hypothetical protein NDU88_004654 [Pleurodeles waltl]
MWSASAVGALKDAADPETPLDIKRKPWTGQQFKYKKQGPTAKPTVWEKVYPYIRDDYEGDNQSRSSDDSTSSQKKFQKFSSGLVGAGVGTSGDTQQGNMCLQKGFYVQDTRVDTGNQELGGNRNSAVSGRDGTSGQEHSYSGDRAIKKDKVVTESEPDGAEWQEAGNLKSKELKIKKLLYMGVTKQLG